MYTHYKPKKKPNIWTSLVQRLFGKEIEQRQMNRPFRVKSTLPPRDRLVLDSNRYYRYDGVNGWKLQGYTLDGKILLATNVYKQIDLIELRALNKELAENADPRIGAPYQIRRSSGALESFLFQGINPINKKLMMVKPEGYTVSVSEDELARENSFFSGQRYRAAY